MARPKRPPGGDRLPTGEDATLERIGRRLEARQGPPPTGELWGGDDAAVVHPGRSDQRLVLTTDAMVAGVHADLSLVGPADFGWKALTTAVSDIAAMGGTPAQALVAVGAPPASALEELADGLGEAANAWACPVVGGDLSEADQLFVAVAVNVSVTPASPLMD